MKTGTWRILAALSMRAQVVVMRSKLAMAVLNLSCMSQRKKAVLGSSIRAVRNAEAAILSDVCLSINRCQLEEVYDGV